MEIIDSKGFVHLVDPEDADLSAMKWSAHPKGYATRQEQDGTHRSLHRTIMDRMEGRRIGRNETVDHKDRNPRDSRRGNLRLVTHGGNRHNSTKVRSANIHGVKGVIRDNRRTRRPFFGKIWFEGRCYYGPARETAEEAHQDYRELSRKHYGDISPYNGE